jgi:hypothetical protein
MPNAPVMCALEAAPSKRVPYQSRSVLVVARGDSTVVRPGGAEVLVRSTGLLSSVQFRRIPVVADGSAS